MTTDPARELWFVAPRAVQVRAGEAPRPAPGEVLARALASGISQGTELLLYRGEGPTPFDPSLGASGPATYPRRYGYAWVGQIVAHGPGIEAPAVGTRLFAFAPHGDLHVLPASELRVIDATIPPARAVLAANLETAVTCAWDCGASLGDQVVVLGGGVVGLLATFALTAVGARVRLVEPSPRRRELGRTLGAAETFTPEADDPGGDADVVVEATGNPASLDRAILHAAPEAAIVIVSFYGARTAPLHLGAEFHRRRLVLRSSQVSNIPPSRLPRWDAQRRFAVVRRLLHDARLDALLDDRVGFDDAPGVYARLDADPATRGQTFFDYR